MRWRGSYIGFSVSTSAGLRAYLTVTCFWCVVIISEHKYVPVLRVAVGLQRRVLQRARRLSGPVRSLLSAMLAAARESAAIAAVLVLSKVDT